MRREPRRRGQSRRPGVLQRGGSAAPPGFAPKSSNQRRCALNSDSTSTPRSRSRAMGRNPLECGSTGDAHLGIRRITTEALKLNARSARLARENRMTLRAARNSVWQICVPGGDAAADALKPPQPTETMPLREAAWIEVRRVGLYSNLRARLLPMGGRFPKPPLGSL